jgi:hypothetical protein
VGGAGSGQDIVIDAAVDSLPVVAGTAEMTFGNGGLLFVSGGTGLLRLPAGGPLSGAVFYAGKATLTNPTFSLSALVALGACPAATGQGALSFCFDSNFSCPNGKLTTTTGVLNGTAFDWGGTANYKDSGASTTSLHIIWKSGARLLAAHKGNQNGGSIMSGFLLTPASGPDPGAFWCADGGNFKRSLGATTINVSGLTRLGTKAEGMPTSGDIEGCY